MTCAIKCDPKRLPEPLLKPTKPYRGRDGLQCFQSEWSAVHQHSEEHGKLRLNMKNAWTDEQVEKLHDLCLRHIPYDEIAEELGRTEGAVRVKIAKMGWGQKTPGPKKGKPMPRWTSERTEELITMVRNGHSPKEAALRFGVTDGAIYHKIAKLRGKGEL